MRIIFITGIILLASLAVWKVGIPLYKRRALVRAWMPYLQKAGSKITEDELVKKLKKVDDRDINSLIDFSRAIEDKKWLQVATSIPQALVIFKKADIDFKTIYPKLG